MDHGLELFIPILEILEIRFFQFSHILEILEICFLLIFWIFPKKTRAEISRRMVRFSRRDLSYETDSGPKTKTVSDPNFQVTAAAATATATSQQLSHLARALDHHAHRSGQSLTSIIGPPVSSTGFKFCPGAKAESPT